MASSDAFRNLKKKNANSDMPEFLTCLSRGYNIHVGVGSSGQFFDSLKLLLLCQHHLEIFLKSE